MQNPVYEQTKAALSTTPKAWLVTGVAGFIGSHLLEALLKLNQLVIGLDNFSTGFKKNLEEVRIEVTPQQWQRFSLLEPLQIHAIVMLLSYQMIEEM